MDLFPFLPGARISLQSGWLPSGPADALLAGLLEGFLGKSIASTSLAVR